MIELAYLSALLEQQCGSSLHIHKLDIVRRFLEDVVEVVPFESIAYAITNGNRHTALQCIRALIKPNVKIPISALMYSGLRDAEYQLKYGVPLQLIYTMDFEAREKITRSTGVSSRENMYTDSGKLIYEVNQFFPGTVIPVRKPVRIITDVSSFKSRAEFDKQMVDYVKQLQHSIFDSCRISFANCDFERMEAVSRANIEDLYPISGESSSGLKSPLDVLTCCWT